MARDVFGWVDGNRYVADVGSEEHLAARIVEERVARDWSQSELARQMADVGCPIPQTAISKIERPQRGGRRGISVDELIAFGKVFSVPVGELVLPANVLRQVRARQALLDVEAALSAKQEAEDRYDRIVSDIAVSAVEDTELMARLTEMRARQENYRGTKSRSPKSAKPLPSHIDDVFRAIDQIRERTHSRSRTAAEETS